MKLNKIVNLISSKWKQYKHNMAIKKAKREVELMIKAGVLKEHPSENSEFITGYFTVENKDSP